MKEIYSKILFGNNEEKKFQTKEILYRVFETNFLVNAKNKYRPPLPIQQAYRIQANP
jgi:hypothetical protein